MLRKKFWVVRGGPGGLLGHPGGVQEASWGVLGGSGGRLGRVLGALGAMSERLFKQSDVGSNFYQFLIDFGPEKSAQREASWGVKRTQNRSKNEVEI